MKTLHISGGYAKSDLYAQLFSHLDQLGVSQQIYSAVRTNREASYNPPEIDHIKSHVTNILHPVDRLFYRLKLNKLSGDIRKHLDISSSDLIHAHSLYSDGGVAFYLKKEFGLPYMIAVRRTDLHYFMRYRPDLHFIRNAILLNSSKIVVLSPSYYQLLNRRLPTNLWNNIKNKVVIIPNGVSPFWLKDQKNDFEKKHSDYLKILYVGGFDKCKNVLRLMKAVRNLEMKRPVTLTLVGGGGQEHGKILRLLQNDSYAFIDYLGKIKQKEVLREIYREHDMFAMPSYHETFGLVYIEALSQGLPFICSRGEAVDGYFKKNTICESVDPFSVRDIENKIITLSERMDSVRVECLKESHKFNWEDISKRYKSIYEKILLS